jgi:hypothetical protein
MMEAPSMNHIIEAFATKMLLNLAYSAKAAGKEGQNRIIMLSLQVMATFMSSNTGCKLMGET